MAGIGDDAGKLNEVYQKAALAKQQADARTQETPLVVDGVRLCLDCEDAIPAERLQRMPYAVRCVHCQQTHEAREKAGRSRR